jgi:pimeloyl-ACP methyl ester carboxylesterase
VDRLILHTPLVDPSVVRARFHVQAGVMTSGPIFPVISWLSRRRVVSDLYKRLMVEGADVDSGQAEMNFRNQQRASHRAQKEWLRSGLRRHDAPVLAGHLGESLVIVAGDDRLLRRDALERLVNGMPRVHYVCIDDAGHGWNEGFIRGQLDAIGTFLDVVPSPGVTVAA